MWGDAGITTGIHLRRLKFGSPLKWTAFELVCIVVTLNGRLKATASKSRDMRTTLYFGGKKNVGPSIHCRRFLRSRPLTVAVPLRSPRSRCKIYMELNNV